MGDKQNQSDNLTIGRLAWIAEITVDTLRFYERSGLLGPEERTSAGYRLYSRNTLARVQFIRRARETGYNLDQIKRILLLHDQGGSKEDVKAFTDEMIADADEKIKRYSKWRQLFTDISAYLDNTDTNYIDGQMADILMRDQCDKSSH